MHGVFLLLRTYQRRFFHKLGDLPDPLGVSNLCSQKIQSIFNIVNIICPLYRENHYIETRFFSLQISFGTYRVFNEMLMAQTSSAEQIHFCTICIHLIAFICSETTCTLKICLLLCIFNFFYLKKKNLELPISNISKVSKFEKLFLGPKSLIMALKVLLLPSFPPFWPFKPKSSVKILKIIDFLPLCECVGLGHANSFVLISLAEKML